MAEMLTRIYICFVELESIVQIELHQVFE